MLLIFFISCSAFSQITFEDHIPLAPPLLETSWHQKAPYNQACPADSNGYSGHVPTGCVPLAIAQVMNYYKLPLMGYGTATTNTVYGELTAEIGRTPIRWNDTKGIATLLYHVGISYGANYGHEGMAGHPNPRVTSTNIGSVPTNCYTYWNYQYNVKNINEGAYDDSTWHAMLQEELLKKRPVVYGGGGHSFIIDGYDRSWDGTPTYHVVWGAGGAGDGGYPLDDLTPGPFDFTNNQHMLQNFYPREKCLLYPHDNIINVPDKNTLFIWRDIGDRYTLLVNDYPSFRMPILRVQDLTTPVYFTNYLEPNTIYYWKVYIYGGDNEGWSRMHTFKTVEQ